MARKFTLKRGVALATSLVLGVGSLAVFGGASANAAPASVLPQPGNSITADRLPTVQINGVVWSMGMVGNKVFAGGSFTRARPAGAAAGTNETVRNNLLAFDVATGNLDTSFAPDLNGQVLGVAVSPDKTRVYVVGDFTTANGQARRRVAAFNASTGALITAFNPVGVTSQARAVVATNDTVYVGGGFNSAGSSSRRNLAAFRASDGALLPWNPAADRTVWGLAEANGSVFAAGQFTTINEQSAYGLGKINGTSGELVSAWDPMVNNAGPDAAVGSLRYQNGFLYGTTWHFGPGGNLEGTFKLSPDGNGDVAWVTDCHGDNYDAFVSQGTVYTAGHAHYCGNMGGGFPQYSAWKYQHAQAWSDTVTGDILREVHGYTNWGGVKPGPAMINWLPTMTAGTYTGQSQAGWTVNGNDDYIVYGGEFPRINGVAQQGLVRFGKRPVAPGKEGPKFPDNTFVPQLEARSATSVRITWPAAYDRDDRTLTYQVRRNGSVRHTMTAESNWWTLPALGWVDEGLTPGATYTYQTVVSDASGNQVWGSSRSITLPNTVDADNAYAQSVKNAGATLYWPLNDTRSGSPMAILDRAGFNDGVADNDVNAGQPGAIAGDAAMTFSAAQPNQPWGRIYAKGTETAPDVFSTQFWIRTNTTRGGRIFGFSDLQQGNSGHRDRHVYMNNAGKLIFGVKATDGSLRTITTGPSFNDNQWHMVTATMGAEGMALYVDGVRVGRRSDTTGGEAYLGSWRVQGDSLGGWPTAPTTTNFQGSIDEVAVYPTALSQNSILAQYEASGRTAVVPPAPADGYGAAVYADDPDLYWRFNETSGSTAADSGRSLNRGTYRNGVVLNQEGVIAGNRAARFDGSNDIVTSQTQFSNPTVYSVEAWFKTTSTAGGKIIGFGNSETGNSGSYDRHVYMLPNGRVVFGTYTGVTNTIESTVPYNNGEWHHVVASQSSAGMKLYIDGDLVATGAETQAQNYSGYWRVGGDSTWAGATHLNGTIDEFAVYSAELPAGRVLAHYQAGGGVTNEAPTAAFTSSADQRRVTFSGSGTDADGTIAAYAWEFGDGSTSTQQNPTHVYTTSGTFTAKLTVTDNRGATGSITHPVTVTAPPGPADTYGSSVSADNPRIYWRLDETSGTTATDVAGGLSHGTYVGAPEFAQSGAIANPNPAVRFDDNKFLASNDVFASPTVYSTEAWFKTTTTSGGKIVGFGNSATGLSNNYDRHVYMQGDGKLVFGVWTGAENKVTTTDAYNDGQWHHVVATQSGSGMKLYVDGVLRGTHAQSQAQPYDGYWKVGGDVTWGSDPWFDGTIDEVAIYQHELDQGRVQAHFQAAQPVPNVPPTASFTVSKSDLQVAVDATAASDIDGTIESYAWNFGDNNTGTGANATHTYAASGTYTITLTVTDDDGATSTTTREVSVLAANVNPVAAFTPTVDFLDLSVNASASGDPDGTIESYEWDFGDGHTDTGVTASHRYTSAGNFAVKLTVTDNRGGTHSVTHQVTTVMPPNQKPTARFDSTVTKLKVSFDASDSDDPDGTVSSYSWDFGDGHSGTGVSPNHTYASAGSWNVKLTVTDNGGQTDEVTHTVVTVANQAPTAAFTHTVNNLAVSFNSSGSSDPDGTIASRSWNFGDSNSATSANPNHTYASAGTYTVRLTVTDNDGATDVKEAEVVVTAPSQIAADDFNRTVNNGWGDADLGGSWTRVGTASNFQVSGGSATIRMAAGAGPSAYLNGVSALDAEMRTSVSYNKDGGGAYTSFILRRIGTSDYRTMVRVTATSTTVQLLRMVDGTSTSLTNTTVAGGALAADEVIHVRFQVSGTSPTTLRVKAWRGNAAEPTAWLSTVTDSTAALQNPGAVGVYSYLSGSATNAPMLAKFDEFVVEPI